MHKALKDLLDENKIAELATSKDAQEAFLGKNGLIKELIKNTLEAALKAEMTHHLEPEQRGVTIKNKRNAKSVKTMKSESGDFELDVPRDRAGELEPQLIKKHQRRLAGLDHKIIALYARGLSTRDIQTEIQEMYGVELSPTLILQLTDNVMDEVKAWQSRPLEALYPIVFLDALVVKIKESRQIINKAVFWH